MRLLHAHELATDLACATEHVHTPGRDCGLNQSAEEPPEDARRKHVPDRVVPCGAHADGDVVLASCEPPKEVPGERRGFLKIRRHHGDQVALGRCKSGLDRTEGAEVA